MQKNIAYILQTIIHVGEHIEEEFKKESSFKNLTSRQLYCIELIKEARNPSLSELAEKMNIAKASMSVMINRLEKQKYIFKITSDKDRRSAHIHLSEKGEKAAALHTDIHSKIANIITSEMTESEKEHFSEFLNKSQFSLNKYLTLNTNNN